MEEYSYAVVTGAARGIGKAISERLHNVGRRVIAFGGSAEGLAALHNELGLETYPLDVTDVTAARQAWGELFALRGAPSLVVNNAGITGPAGDTWTLSLNDWWRVIEVNLMGPALISRLALPSMLAKGEGRIVNVASNAACSPIGGDPSLLNSAYMASKAGVIRWTEALAHELAHSGVRAFAISPGKVKTDMTAAMFGADWDNPNEWWPIDWTADLVEEIDRGGLDQFSGRFIHAARDDWRTMSARAQELLEADALTLRVKRA